MWKLPTSHPDLSFSLWVGNVSSGHLIFHFLCFVFLIRMLFIRLVSKAFSSPFPSTGLKQSSSVIEIRRIANSARKPFNATQSFSVLMSHWLSEKKKSFWNIFIHVLVEIQETLIIFVTRFEISLGFQV